MKYSPIKVLNQIEFPLDFKFKISPSAKKANLKARLKLIGHGVTRRMRIITAWFTEI